MIKRLIHFLFPAFYYFYDLMTWMFLIWNILKVNIILHIHTALLRHDKMDWGTFNPTVISLLSNSSIYLYEKKNCLLISVIRNRSGGKNPI